MHLDHLMKTVSKVLGPAQVVFERASDDTFCGTVINTKLIGADGSIQYKVAVASRFQGLISL